VSLKKQEQNLNFYNSMKFLANKHFVLAASLVTIGAGIIVFILVNQTPTAEASCYPKCSNGGGSGGLAIESVLPSPADTTATVTGDGNGGQHSGGGSFTCPPGTLSEGAPITFVTAKRLLPPSTYVIDGGSGGSGSYSWTEYTGNNVDCDNLDFTPKTYRFNIVINTASMSNGTHTIQIFALDEETNTTVSATASFLVQHPAPADFSLNCDTNSQTVQQGQSAAYSIRATSLNGFSGQVAVDITSGLHSTMGYTQAVLNVPSGGFANSPSVPVTTQLTTPAGTYTLTFRGVSGSITKTCQATLNVTVVPGPAVDIAASPNPVSVNPANNIATTSLSWLISNSTSCNKTSSPANASWGSSPTPVAVTPANGGPVSVNLTVNTTFTISCSNSAGVTVSDSELVVVNPNPAFTVSPATTPAFSFTGVQNNNATISPGAQNFTVTNTGNVLLSLRAASDKGWTTLGLSTFDLAPGVSTTVSVVPNSTSTSIPVPDTATITFTDISASSIKAPSQSRQVRYTLSSPPSFTLDCANINPNTSQTVTRGATASWAVPVRGSNGFNQTVTLAITANYPSNSTPVNATVPFSGSPNPENRSGSVQLQTGATTQTGTFNTITVTASAAGYAAQQCNLAPLIVNAYEFNVTPNSLSFTATQGAAANPSAKIFQIVNNGTTSLTFTVTKSTASTWFTMNGSTAQSITGITVGPNGGIATISVQPNTTTTAGNFSDNNVIFNSNSTAGTQTKSVDYQVSAAALPTPPTISFLCSANNTAYTTGPCQTTSSGVSGYLSWTVSPAADSCSMDHNLLNYNTPASPPAPAGDTSVPTSHTGTATNPLSSNTTFRITCRNAGGSDSKTVSFTIPAAGTYNLRQSAKHAVAVNQPSLSLGQLVSANTNPCDGQGRITDPTINYKEGDLVTFAINICNTGTGDLQFPGSGTNGYVIQLNDVLGNLVKPAGGWNAQVNCGVDCQLGTVNDTSQPGVVTFRIDIKAGGSNRLIASGGLWTLFFNATIKAPVGGTQPYYYFTNCVSNSGGNPAMTVKNTSGIDSYNNNFAVTPAVVDVPGFCMQALFSRGGSAPDRHEIAP
jgi:hypothetical protein